MPSNKRMIVRIVALLCLTMSFSFVVRAETQSLETLLAYLKSPFAKTRRDAAQKLGERRVRNQLAVEALAVAAEIRFGVVTAVRELLDVREVRLIRRDSRCRNDNRRHDDSRGGGDVDGVHPDNLGLLRSRWNRLRGERLTRRGEEIVL